MLASLDSMGHLLKKRLPPDKCSSQHNLSTAAFLQSAAVSGRFHDIAELAKVKRANIRCSHREVPAVGEICFLSAISVEKLLKFIQLIVRDSTGVLRRKFKAFQQTYSVVSTPASIFVSTKMFNTLQLLTTKIAEAIFASAIYRPGPLSIILLLPAPEPTALPAASETCVFLFFTSAAFDTRVFPPSDSTTESLPAGASFPRLQDPFTINIDNKFHIAAKAYAGLKQDFISMCLI